MIIKGHGEPTSCTYGNVGDIYVDLDTKNTYECTCQRANGKKTAFVTVFAEDVHNTEFSG